MELWQYDITKAEYLGGYRISLEFRDGEKGTLDFSRYFNHTYYKCLEDPEIFSDYKVESGILTWLDGELDIAPETVYHDATGIPLPAWLTT